MAGRIIDLTLHIEEGMSVYPGDPEVTLEPWLILDEDGCNMTHVSMGTHTGTHMDAPYHFLDGGAKVDEIPLDACVGPAVVLDFSMKNQGDSIPLSELKKYERFICQKSRILIRTDWGQQYGSAGYFESWPCLTKEASTWLARRGIFLLGMETPSVDQRHCNENHLELLRAGVVIVEALVNLSLIKGNRVNFCALPLSFVGKDGSPVRAIAREEGTGGTKTECLQIFEDLQESRPFSASFSMGKIPSNNFPIKKKITE